MYEMSQRKGVSVISMQCGYGDNMKRRVSPSITERIVGLLYIFQRVSIHRTERTSVGRLEIHISGGAP